MSDHPTDDDARSLPPQSQPSGKLRSEESPTGASFEQLASEQDPGIVREFIDFLRYNKKWWLTPILVVTLLLIGAAILLPSPVAPFIYTLF